MQGREAKGIENVEMSGVPSTSSKASNSAGGSTSSSLDTNTGTPLRASTREGEQREELDVEVVARKMFYGGCALLPWLWLVNIIYFRKLYFAEDCPPGVRTCECIKHLESSPFVVWKATYKCLITTFNINTNSRA